MSLTIKTPFEKINEKDMRLKCFSEHWLYYLLENIEPKVLQSLDVSIHVSLLLLAAPLIVDRKGKLLLSQLKRLCLAVTIDPSYELSSPRPRHGSNRHYQYCFPGNSMLPVATEWYEHMYCVMYYLRL